MELKTQNITKKDGDKIKIPEVEMGRKAKSPRRQIQESTLWTGMVSCLAMLSFDHTHDVQVRGRSTRRPGHVDVVRNGSPLPCAAHSIPSL